MSTSAKTPLEIMREHGGLFVTGVPHAGEIGMEITDLQKGEAWARIPYREDLVGDADTGVIAGGAITTLLDSACGAAALAALETPAVVATLDLRIDYMRPAEPGLAVNAYAECRQVTRSVAFVRAVAYERDRENPIAHAAGAFMIKPFAVE